MQLQSVKALQLRCHYHRQHHISLRSVVCNEVCHVFYMQNYLRGSVHRGMGASDQMPRCMSAVCMVFAQWADSMLVHAVLKHLAFACHMHEVLVTQHCQETFS